MLLHWLNSQPEVNKIRKTPHVEAGTFWTDGYPETLIIQCAMISKVNALARRH